MKWIVVKRTRVQPSTGGYRDWKHLIADDCFHQCVYCSIGENHYGGIDNFHVDHFRPVSRFVNLENEITNLYLACAICNRFKSNNWPCEPIDDGSLPSFLNPGAVSYHLHIQAGVDLKGISVAGKYMVEQLYLNRPQLLLLRRYILLLERLDVCVAHFEGIFDDLIEVGKDGAEIARSVYEISLWLHRHRTQGEQALPYRHGDTIRRASARSHKGVKAKMRAKKKTRA